MQYQIVISFVIIISPLINANVDSSFCHDLKKDYCVIKYVYEDCPNLCNNTNGVWSAWSDWFDCSRACGNGTGTRSRTCITQQEQSCIGNATETGVCYGKTCGAHTLISDINDCFVKCNNSAGHCPSVCPIGSLCCKNNEPGCTSDVGSVSVSNYMCVIVSQSGDLDGFWGEWHYGECKETCGASNARHRVRNCDSPARRNNGAPCEGAINGAQSQTELVSEGCSTQACPPVIPKCPSYNPFAYDEGRFCCKYPYDCRDKPLTLSSNCCYGTALPCPNATCINYQEPPICPNTAPYAYNNGLFCCSDPISNFIGSSDDPCLQESLHWRANQKCCKDVVDTPCTDQTHGCVTKKISQWTRWRDCSASCGESGTRGRNRTCFGENIGLNCDGTERKETERCNLIVCSVDGGFSDWSSWVTWYASTNNICSLGYKYSSRSCTNPVPKYGGANCSALGTPIKIESTDDKPCPLDGQWSSWTTWSVCDKVCSTGSQNRSRLCDLPQSRFDGKDCVGDGNETQSCNTEPCPTCSPPGFTCSTWRLQYAYLQQHDDVTFKGCADLCTAMGACFGFDYNLNVRSCNLSSNSREFVPLENSTDVFFIQCEKTDGYETTYKNVGKSWADAQADCEAWEGNLLTISSKEQNDFYELDVLGKPEKAHWLGINDKQTNDLWEWKEDSFATNYTKWWTVRPINGRTDFACGELRSGFVSPYYFNGTWLDGTCADIRRYYCIRPKSFLVPAPAGSPPLPKGSPIAGDDVANTTPDLEKDPWLMRIPLGDPSVQLDDNDIFTSQVLPECSISDYTCNASRDGTGSTSATFTPVNEGYCATKCNKDSNCTGYDYDVQATTCKLSTDAEPQCKKIGKPKNSPWTSWSACDTSCSRTRQRSCVLKTAFTKELINDSNCLGQLLQRNSTSCSAGDGDCPA